MTDVTIPFEGIDPIQVLGVNDARLNLYRNSFQSLKVNARGTSLKAQGNQKDLELFEEKIKRLLRMIDRYETVSDKQVEDLFDTGYDIDITEEMLAVDDVIVHGPNGIQVKARTPNQKRMVEFIASNDIMFAIGPAGTGKTYTAVALAVRALKNKSVKKIILTRPAVEAGENLGFLPGDLKEKIDPYLRPLYDALDDMIPFDKLNYYIANRVIEIAPLAYMRGRTLDNAFIILDESQNTTELQMKMFLTRIGPQAKCIITGDLTQIDLPKKQVSGLTKALSILQNIKGISLLYLSDKDVLRHRLVKEIIKAYDSADKPREDTVTLETAPEPGKDVVFNEDRTELNEE